MKHVTGPRLGIILALGLVAGAILLVIALGPLAWWLAQEDAERTASQLTSAAIDTARQRLLQVGAGLLAIGALTYTARNYRISRRTYELSEQVSRRTHELAEQGQVTERFTRAIDQLGSEKLDIRLGGIYALARIARDSDADRATIREVLAAFVRERSSIYAGGGRAESKALSVDIAAALSVVAEREIGEDRIDLRFTDLTGVVLSRSLLDGADFRDSTVAASDLSHSSLVLADFSRANLAGAKLIAASAVPPDEADQSSELEPSIYAAQFVDADLTGADLSIARLPWADLTRSKLIDAKLMGAELMAAKLVEADMSRALMAGVNLSEADLSRADLTGANLLAANFDQAILHGANLTDVEYLTLDQLAAAQVDELTIRPRRFARLDPAGTRAYYEDDT